MKIINVKHPLRAYRKFSIAALLFFSAATILAAQSTPKTPRRKIRHPESRASRDLEAARANPLALRAWLLKMPKGADLHIHLTGAVYAESFIRAAAEDNLCVDTTKLAFVRKSWARPLPNRHAPRTKSRPRTPSRINISTTR